MTRPWLLCVALIAPAVAGCSSVYEYPDPAEERGAEACQDGVDNDLNGSVDCADPTCDGFCPEESRAECMDGRDNDGDGLFDVADARCWLVSPPRAKRCAGASGIDIIETFDGEPEWMRSWALWRRWGSTRDSFVVSSGFHAGGERRDRLITFAGKTSDTGALGAYVRQRPFSGSFQGFELSFGAALPRGGLLRAAIVPVEQSPSQDAPLPGADNAVFALTLDFSVSPPTLAVAVKGVASVESELCDGDACIESFGRVTVTLDSNGFLARFTAQDGTIREVRAEAPSSLTLPASRLVFFGGSLDPAMPVSLDDVRLEVGPEWPCGFAVPQVPGESCELGAGLSGFGQGASVARHPEGDEHCALVTASTQTSGGSLDTGISRFQLAWPPTTVTAWSSQNGDSWTSASSLDESLFELPAGATLIGTAVAASSSGWHAAVSYREGRAVRVAFADAGRCDDWSALSGELTLFEDAEPPSYVVRDEAHEVFFTRPPTDQTGRTLWRARRDAAPAEPELLAELPEDVAPPVSITRVGGRDLVLVSPNRAGEGNGGIGLFVGDESARKWDPTDPHPILELPPRIDLNDGQGRLAFDDRGVLAAALAWGADGGFLLYGGSATVGLGGARRHDPVVTVGTARLALAGTELPGAVVPEDRCGDGVCSPPETCSSCAPDCTCVGPTILDQVFDGTKPWELRSSDPQRAAMRYLTADPPGLSLLSGEPTWSVLPLERAVAGDFELSFDFLASCTFANLGSSCAVYVGLGGFEPSHPSPESGAFVYLQTAVDWYQAGPLILENGMLHGTPLLSALTVEGAVPMGIWQRIALRREGAQFTVSAPHVNGCGTVERSVELEEALPARTALLVGFGGGSFRGCSRSCFSSTIANVELRLLDDPQQCPGGKRRCGGGSEEAACFDTATSAEHCGACDQRCAASEVCRGGSCACSELPGILECDGGCVDSLASSEHCGGCGNACPALTRCQNGQCGVAGDCASPFALPPEGGTVSFVATPAPVDRAILCDYFTVVDELVLAWTPTETGTGVVQADPEENRSLDTVVGVTTDSSCETWLACHDDVVPTAELGSYLAFPVEAGTTYLIAVGRWDYGPGETGSAVVQVGLLP